MHDTFMQPCIRTEQAETSQLQIFKSHKFNICLLFITSIIISEPVYIIHVFLNS